MSIAFQALIFLLVVLSFILVIGVPVILASPGEWERSQKIVYAGATLWVALVISVGVFDSLIV
uniref:Photosystem II reaction center protein Z n=2 Tax=Glaucocystis TaxID=38258 RepID=A0A3G1IVD3_9EUKA|nr:photosystem II protein Z [Glaucocystis incrassata]ASQ39926.1 photosystem II protein Z [Glaucocystis sp. BBH]ASQ40005.1 photosystem II protein Z [Glaucocystis incrassata]